MLGAHSVYAEAESANESLAVESLHDILKNYCRITTNRHSSESQLVVEVVFFYLPKWIRVVLELKPADRMILKFSMNDRGVNATIGHSNWTREMISHLDFEVLNVGSNTYTSYLTTFTKKYIEAVETLLPTNEEIYACAIPGESNELPLESAIKEITQSLSSNFISSNPHPPIEYSRLGYPYSNFFSNFLFYLEDKLLNFTKYCPICCEKHEIEPIKLRPCRGKRCELIFEEVSGISLYSELKTDPEFLMIELSLAYQSVFSSRCKHVFEPFPTFHLFQEQARGRSGFLSGNYTPAMDANKNTDKIRELFLNIPNLQQIKNLISDEITCREYFTSNVPLGEEVFRLVKYVISTNRGKFIKLEGSDCIPGLTNGITQYLVADNSPDTLKLFNERKKNFNAFFFARKFNRELVLDF